MLIAVLAAGGYLLWLKYFSGSGTTQTPIPVATIIPTPASTIIPTETPSASPSAAPGGEFFTPSPSALASPAASPI